MLDKVETPVKNENQVNPPMAPRAQKTTINQIDPSVCRVLFP